MSLRNPFRVKTAFVLLVLLAGFAAPASAVISEFSILMNTDVSPVTGCDVTTVDGVFPGVEHVLITTVDTTGASLAQVIRIERQVCVNPATDTFGPRILVDETDRPVGVGLGIGGFNVVETYFPLSALPVGPPNGPGVVRLGVTSLNATGGQDALLTVTPTGNQPIQIILAVLTPANVPTLSEWGLILLGLLLATAALVILRRRSATALLAALVLFTGAGIAWAAASDLDGNTLGEWGAPLANDTAGDAPVGADIRAFFGMEDGPTSRVYFRLDVSLQFSVAPDAVDDAYTTPSNTPLNVPAPGVLGNDTVNGATISAFTTPTANGGTVALNADGSFTYTPAAGFTGTDTFTYTLTNPAGSDTATVTVNVANQFPVATDDTATVTEDDPATAINVLANDTDVEGDPFTIASVTQPANGTVVITGGGTGLTYQPNANDCNTPPGTTLETFTYTLTPGGDSATVTVTVNCVDDAPTAVNDAATVAEDAAATAVDVLANDTDPDAGPISITSVTQPANGTVVITGGGTGLTYQPNADYCNTPPGTTLDTFTYTLTPGGSTATVTMTVTCDDDPPTAVNDAATVAEDSGANAIDVLANDTDTDGGPISITSVTQPANGTVVITGGGTGLTYQPNTDYCNTPPGTTLDTFTYTLTPGGSSATVTVTVNCADDGPTAVNDTATVTEDSGANAIDVLANDTDPDGGTNTITSVTQPANGTVVITGGGTGLTYQPNADYCNTPPGTPLDTFTYTLTPGGSVGTVTVTVNCSDDAPTAVNDAATVLEDSGANTINVQANDTDPDGGTNTITAVTQPANGTVAITNGGADLTYTPNANYCNTPPGTTLDTFTYTLTPGGSVATVTVTVTCVDDNPVAVMDAATVNEDSGANTINVLANDTDIDAGPISITSVTQPANGAVVITNGGADLTYAPNANYCNNPPGTTPDTFTYTLAPGGSTATVTVSVTCLNDGPVIDLDANNDQGTAGNDFAVTFTEGNPATLIEDPLDATLTDADNATLASLTVTITNLLDVGSETLSADVTGTSITANYVAATGVLTLTGPDTLANFQTVLRTVRYLNSDSSPDTTPRVIHFVANDGTTNGNTAVSTVTVVSVDTAPTAVADAATVNEDSGANAIDVLANDTDPDGGPISITSVTQPTNGTVAITGGGTGLTYTPNANYCNSVSGVPDTFTYMLTPGSSSTTVTVTVTCVDDNPVAVADAATVNEDSGANAINVLANDTDPDGGPISITSVTQPANGAVAITGGGTGLTYTPNANYCNNPPGTTLDTFTYTLTPGGSVATVTVTVTCIDDNPTAVNDSATVVEDSGTNAINVLANDTDPDGGAISITSVTQPANGTVAITGGGTGLTYAPNANYCNTPPGTTLDTFTYTLTPGGSVATVTVTVTCVDDPPVAVADSATVIEDSGANTLLVMANDTDVDGGTNTITSVTQPANGVVAIAGGGTSVTYTPNANYCNNPPGTTLETFNYTLTPGGSSTTVTVTVTCVNDPPVADPDAFDFIGNTDLVVDLAALPTPHALETTPSTLGVVDGDSDPVENNAISVTAITVGVCTDSSAPLDCSDPAVGRVQMQSNGRFIFTPAPGDAGATETFQYTLTDNGVPAPASAIGTVTLTRFERVWYVKNDAPAGGNGTSSAPFNSITPANLSDNDGDGDLTDDLDSAGDYIFVYFGTGTAANQSGGLVLENNQHLIGQHAGLSLNVNLNGNGAPTNLVNAAAGSRPLLDDTVVDAFEGVSARNVVPAEIVGMNLAGNVNAIDWTTTAAFAGTGTFSIRDNVIRSAANEGVDINLAGTSVVNLAFHDNNLTSTGSALDIQETGTGSLTITAFDDNVVSGNTGGSGIVISNAVFDSVPGGGLNTVDGGTTVIGASGNGVGGAGMALGNVQGDLHFTGNLNIFADGGAGLTVSGTGAGTQFRVNSGGAPTGIVEATGGPAVDASATAFDLRLTSLRSTNSASTGVSLTNVTGTFSAESGSSITNSTGTDFAISGGTANVTYRGTITDDVGQLVSVSGATAGTKSFEGAITDGDDGDGSGISLSGNTGATVRFSGGLILSTGGNAAFAATGGGTVEVCDENPCNGGATGGLVNRITTTTATALNVANTTIGANNLELRSVSAGTGASGPVNGIVVNNTGSSGGLKVKGTGAAGSGGTIQNTTGDGISLTSTAAVSLSFMNVQNGGEDGIDGTSVNGFSITGSNVTNNGNAANEEGISLANVSGAVSMTSTAVTSSAYNNLRIDNTTGTVSLLNVAGSSFNNSDVGTGNHGALIEIRGTSQLTTASVTGSSFSGNKVMGIQVATGDTATVSDFTFSGNTITNNELGIDFSKAQTSNLTFEILNNTGMTGQNSHGINLFTAVGAGTSGVFQGRIEGNTIGNTGVASSGSAIGNCIRVNINGDADASVLINNNTIRQCPNGRGIEVIGRNGTGGLDVTVTNNDVNPQDTSGSPLAAILVQSNCATVCNTVRSDVRGNTVPAGATTDLLPTYIALVETSTSVLQLVDTPPASANCTAQLTSTNTGSASASAGCALIAGPISTPP